MVELYFSQDTSIERLLLEMIAASRASIGLAAYRLTNLRLMQALADAHQRGLDVRVVLDTVKFEANPALAELFSRHGVPHCAISGRQGPPTKMHHKFAIFDDHIVSTGSYNWTEESEEQNLEDLIILRDEALVARYRRTFDQLWQRAARAASAD